MDTVVSLEELEKALNVKFPKTFHEIYSTEAMEWLKHSYAWLDQNRDLLENRTESFLYSVKGDYEPIIFPEIPETIAHFEEMLGYNEAYSLGKLKIHPEYRFIPFAIMGSGDLYCFWYEEDTTEPKVVIYGHNTGNMNLWAKDFDEFLFIQLATAVTDWDDDIYSTAIQSHIKFLKNEYKEMFQYGNIEKIKSFIESIGELRQLQYLVEV